MSKQRLIIMRHAKSDWSVDSGADFDRPLSSRGRKTAPQIGKWLKREALIPDQIVSSPALRAYQTAEVVAETLGIKPRDIVKDERIYEAPLRDLLTLIEEHASNARTLMIIGHNPGLDELLCHLAADPPPRDASGKLMTTGAVAVLEFDGGYSTTAGAGRLLALMRPKELKP